MFALKKLDSVWTHIETILVAVLLFVVMTFSFWAIFTRFVLNNASPWAEEACRYLTIWATFIGASLGVKRGAHIGVEAFVVALPKSFHKYFDLLVSIICACFTLIIAVVGYQYLQKLGATNQLSPAMRLPITYAYAAVPIGCTFMTLRYLYETVMHIYYLVKKMDIPKSDELQTGGA